MGAVYRAHIHGRGWTDMAKDNTYVNGPKDTYVTAVAASLENQPEGMTGTIAYQVNLSGSGWMDWQENLGEAGATDTDKPLEAVRMQLTGQLSENYDLYYSVLQNGSWTALVRNGETGRRGGPGTPGGRYPPCSDRKGRRAADGGDPHGPVYRPIEAHGGPDL